MAYDRYPAVDETCNFPPEVVTALSKQEELRGTILSMTTIERDALSGSDLWMGRVVFNTTTSRLNRYNSITTTWYAVTDENDDDLAANIPSLRSLGDGELQATPGNDSRLVHTCTSTTRPSHAEGRVIYESDTDRLLVSNGLSWSVASQRSNLTVVNTTSSTGITITNNDTYTSFIHASTPLPALNLGDVYYRLKMSAAYQWRAGNNCAANIAFFIDGAQAEYQSFVHNDATPAKYGVWDSTYIERITKSVYTGTPAIDLRASVASGGSPCSFNFTTVNIMAIPV